MEIVNLQENDINQIALTLISNIEIGTPFVTAVDRFIHHAGSNNIHLDENNFLIIMALVAARVRKEDLA